MTGLDRATPAGVILTGGASRRMGRDKAFVEVDGLPMVVRVAGALASAGCSPVWCQGGDVVRLRAIGLDARLDPEPGTGPVPAIVGALRRAGGQGVMVAACDLPDLDASTVRRLIGPGPAALATDGVAHLVAWLPAGIEVPAGAVRYRTLLDAIGARLVEVPPLRNVNTPADL